MRQAAVLFILALAFPVLATVQPATSRGFTAEGAYHVHGIDAVNDFTGNLEVTIPIGPTFTTTGSLTYSFKLRYHSNLWDMVEHSGGDGWAPGAVPTHWDRQPPLDAFPSRDFNAGLGWRFSDGSYLKNHPLTSERGKYVDSDGAQHHTSATPAGGGSLVLGTFYTDDSTYKRITRTAGGTYTTVDHPDGTRERLVCISGCGTVNEEWGLDQKSDPFGNVLYVTRQGSTWTYTEAFGTTPHPDHNAGGLTTVRTHEVIYSGGRVAQVKLSSAGSGHRAVYTLQYQTRGILRPYLLSKMSSPTVPFGVSHGENRMSLDVLTGIVMPPNDDGSSSGDWSFQYIIDPDPADYPGDVQTFRTPDNQYSWQASHYGGLLERIVLPTGGRIRYKYDVRHIQRYYCSGAGEAANQGFSTIAVRERAVLKPSGELDGPRPWRYFGRMFNVGWWQGPQRELVSGTLDPFGNLEVSYFSVYISEGCAGSDNGFPPADPYSKYEWGMSYSKEEKDAEGRYLQSRVFQCANAAQFDPPAGTYNGEGPYDAFRRLHTRYAYGAALSCGSPLRSTWASWENDGGYCRGDYNTDCDQFNRRRKSVATVYHDDGDSFTTVTNDQYDGFGHYRSMRTGGNFFARNFPNLSGGDERVELTGWNPGVVFQSGIYSALPNGQTLATMPWVLQTYDLKKIQQAKNGQAGGANPQVSSTLYRFNAATGFLERERRLRRSVDCTWNASTARAACFNASFLDAADVVTAHTRTASGDTVRVATAHYGGDKDASLPTSGDLSTPIGASAEYLIAREYQFGGLKSVAYYDCGGYSPLHIVEQNVVDPYSGLIVSSKDSAGAETLYSYDNLGRFRTIDPPGNDAPTTYTHVAASGTQRARIEAVTANGSTVLRTMTYELDHLGRVAAEKQQVPTDGGNLLDSIRTIEYHANGWKSSESTIGPLAPAGRIVYQDYDPFGRARTRLHADHGTGGDRKTTYQYFGIREEIETTHGVATAGGQSQTTRAYDRFGNLVRVNEPSGAGGAGVRTRYEYDNLNNLVYVDGEGQSRTFNYDMRGFLLSETHPELAGRSIRHLGYDARGNPGQRVLSAAGQPPTPFDVRLRYDGAERLIRVTRIADNEVLKVFNYFPQSGSNVPALSAGKLRRSIRYNWAPPAATPAGAPVKTPVTTEFAYTAQGQNTGRLTRRTLSVSGMTFVTNFTYDALGNPATIQYPQLPSVGPARTISYTYKQGKLVSVPSYASLITYAENGMVRKVVHTNSTADHFEPDADYLPRPSLIRTAFNGYAAWTTGQYGYDANGSISRIGAQTYAYDKVNRLVTATLSNGTESYEYDANGNLRKYLGRGTQNTLPVDASTNRLAAPNATYDEVGNLTRWLDGRDGSEAIRDYDAFSLITHNRGAGQGKIHLYDAADERVAVFDYAGPALRETWSVRGLGNEVLRDFTRVGPTTLGGSPTWTWRDNVYRGSTLLAQVRPGPTGAAEVLHAHVDHLGSIRRLSDGTGRPIDNQDFYPFGEEVDPSATGNRFRFTGHERDSSSSRYGALDYMHARYYMPTLGRFVSVDRGKSASPEEPQSWNRYSYSRNAPLTRVDPNGATDVAFYRASQMIVVTRDDGTVVGWAPAANNASPISRGAKITEAGTYSFIDRRAPHTHGAKGGDTLNGSYGTRGIFRVANFHDSTGTERSGVGIHSGRANRGGYTFETLGCIRTTEDGMSMLAGAASQERLDDLRVYDEPGMSWDPGSLNNSSQLPPDELQTEGDRFMNWMQGQR